ncbi:MAG: DUF1570 domain-containing protein [Planctomycetes bacterium]|nr:DUF1570 domain-containing protein [Planctomycetota bacterium]
MSRQSQSGRRFWQAVSAIIALAAIAGCSRQQGVLGSRGPVPYELEPWSYDGNAGRHLTTAHYDIRTTLRDEYLLSTFPELMEGAFEYYQQLVPASREPQEKMPVYLFATRNQWVDFTRRFTGPRARRFLQIRYGGYSERGVTVIQYAAHQTTFPIMAHEGFHQYLHHYVGDSVPAWLNEGLAVVCEGVRWRGMQIEGFDPWANPLRRNVLAEALLQERLIPLGELLRTHAGEIVGRGPRAIGTYYAQVWALVLYLREGNAGEFAGSFARLLGQLGGGGADRRARAAHIWSEQEEFNPGEALFRGSITEDLETFEQGYVAFMRQKVLGEHSAPRAAQRTRRSGGS